MRVYRAGGVEKRKRVADLPAEEIKRRHASGELIKDLAKEYGFHRDSITRVLGEQAKEIRHSWKTVELPVEQLREEATTMSVSALARKYGCDRRVVYKALGRGPMRNGARR